MGRLPATLLVTLLVSLSLAFIAGSVPQPQPATRNISHANIFKHWGHNYPPLVSANCGDLGDQMCNYTGDAERTWLANGFSNGFQVGNPFQGCGLSAGWIKVCAFGQSSFGLGANGVNVIPAYVNNPTQHLSAMVIQVCSDCGLNLTRLVRKAYGHAIGLGNNFADASVMNNPSGSDSPSAHDRAELTGAMYVNHDDTIYSRQQLDSTDPFLSSSRNENIVSTSRRFRLVQQTDGNLVAYDNGAPYWASNTAGWAGTKAVMQSDGNFVVYSGGNSPIWASNTYGRDPGGRIVMQNDGNVVLYGFCCGATWASGTGGR